MKNINNKAAEDEARLIQKEPEAGSEEEIRKTIEIVDQFMASFDSLMPAVIKNIPAIEQIRTVRRKVDQAKTEEELAERFTELLFLFGSLENQMRRENRRLENKLKRDEKEIKRLNQQTRRMAAKCESMEKSRQSQIRKYQSVLKEK